MCEMYDELLEEKDREFERAENQLIECQREIHRLRSVCRSYEEEIEIKQEWELFSIEDILKRLGARISFTTEDDAEKTFTQEGEKAYEDLKKILLAIEKVTGIDMQKVIERLNNIVF